MRPKPILSLILLAASILVICEATNPVSPFSHSAERQPQHPLIYLWAWERPEDLSFIDPSKIGVAYLAGTYFLDQDEVRFRGRHQPLKAPEGTRLVSVFRIETGSSAQLNRAQVDWVVNHVIQTTRGAERIQIDFDATRSERTFYLDLLIALRQKLEPRKTLHITALASWCMEDRWLHGLPIDGAVPMLFQMGVNQQSVNTWLSKHEDLAPECDSAIGLSLDEPIEISLKGRVLYLFSPTPWKAENVQTYLAGLKL